MRRCASGSRRACARTRRRCTCRKRSFRWRDRKSTRLNYSNGYIYPLSLHDALPILQPGVKLDETLCERITTRLRENTTPLHVPKKIIQVERSEEHTSELQ